MFLILGLVFIRGTLVAAPWLDKLIALGPVFYAIPLAVFSAEHFVGAQFMQSMVPRWIPAHLFWVYFVGLALLSASVSILINRYAGFSGLMLGIMFFLFVALMDLPGTLKSPGNRIFWTLTFRELAFGGAAWTLAGTRAPGWRYSGFLRNTGRIFVAVPTLFFAVQYSLHPASAPGVPLEMTTPSWVPLSGFWGFPMSAILLVTGLGMLLNWQSRLCAASAGLVVTLPVIFIYFPLLLLASQPSGMNEATNYLGDTLLYAGTLFLIAGSAEVRPELHH